MRLISEEVWKTSSVVKDPLPNLVKSNIIYKYQYPAYTNMYISNWAPNLKNILTGFTELNHKAYFKHQLPCLYGCLHHDQSTHAKLHDVRSEGGSHWTTATDPVYPKNMLFSRTLPYKPVRSIMCTPPQTSAKSWILFWIFCILRIYYTQWQYSGEMVVTKYARFKFCTNVNLFICCNEVYSGKIMVHNACRTDIDVDIA